MGSSYIPAGAPFDADVVKGRINLLARSMVKSALVPGEIEKFMTDPAAQHEMGHRLNQLVLDALAQNNEIERLYRRFEELQRKHSAFAGEPGAPAMCASCSLHGVQVPWPCEIYHFAGRSLPSRP